jgi:hypothetical protein
MWKAGLTAIVALIIGSASVVAGEIERESRIEAVKTEASMTLAQIGRLKSVLKLSAEQEVLWPAIERAFREISVAQEEAGVAQGFVQRVKNKAASVGLNALAMRRLAAAAYPLIRTLSEEQKQSGLVFARSTGLDKIAAAF